MLKKFVSRVIILSFVVMLVSLFIALFLAENVELLQTAKELVISGLFGGAWGAIIATVEILHDLGFGVIVKIIVAIFVGAILGLVIGIVMETLIYKNEAVYVTVPMFSFMGLATGVIVNLRLRKISGRKSEK